MLFSWRSMICQSNPLILPRWSQAQFHPVKSMTTPTSPSFHLFRIRSRHPRSEGTPTRQTTSTLTICPDALKSSRRRLNYPDHTWSREILLQTFSCHTRLNSSHCFLSVFTRCCLYFWWRCKIIYYLTEWRIWHTRETGERQWWKCTHLRG